MKINHFLITILVIVAITSLKSLAAELPKMKMTTDMPPGIATPDKLETRIGTLNLFDGVPDKETAKKVFENLYFQRGVQAFMSGIQIASMTGLRKGLMEFGPPNTTIILFENLMDSKALWLTANTTSVYMAAWLELKDEAIVIETPPDVLGIIDNHWFNYVVDFGRLGPDKGKGGKFLILPPDYDDKIPDSYHVARTATYGNWVIWLGFQVNGDPKPAVDIGAVTVRTIMSQPHDDILYFYPYESVWGNPFSGGNLARAGTWCSACTAPWSPGSKKPDDLENQSW